MNSKSPRGWAADRESTGAVYAGKFKALFLQWHAILASNQLDDFSPQRQSQFALPGSSADARVIYLGNVVSKLISP